MKKQMKRLLSLALTASLCLGMVQVSAFAAEETTTSVETLADDVKVYDDNRQDASVTAQDPATSENPTDIVTGETQPNDGALPAAPVVEELALAPMMLMVEQVEEPSEMTLEEVQVSFYSKSYHRASENTPAWDWNDVGIVNELTITLDLDEGQEYVTEEMKAAAKAAEKDISIKLTEEQKAEVLDQLVDQIDCLTGTFKGTADFFMTKEVLEQIDWTELKYVSGDDNDDKYEQGKRAWHLDGKLDLYPTAFFIRLDKTLVNGSHSDTEYFPAHEAGHSWGLVKGFEEPPVDGYKYAVREMVSPEKAEEVENYFSGVRDTIVVFPDLDDENCKLREQIKNNYKVTDEQLKSGEIAILWYVSKEEPANCSWCSYHVDGVVYNKLTGKPALPVYGLRVNHEYYVQYLDKDGNEVGAPQFEKSEFDLRHGNKEESIAIVDLERSEAVYEFRSAVVTETGEPVNGDTVTYGQDTEITLKYVRTEVVKVEEPVETPPAVTVKYLLKVEHQYYVQYLNEAGELVGEPKKEAEETEDRESDIATEVTIGELKRPKEGYALVSHENDREVVLYGENEANTVTLTYVRTETKTDTTPEEPTTPDTEPGPGPNDPGTDPDTTTPGTTPEEPPATIQPPVTDDNTPVDVPDNGDDDDDTSDEPEREEPTVTAPELPAEEPVEEFEDLEEIEVPMAELPEELTVLPDALVPMAPSAEDEEELILEDAEVPLAQVPETGDDMGLWLAAFASAALGLAWLAMGKKKETV